VFSVIIITRGRAEMLKRCLDALCSGSERVPDEIVVAVNGEDLVTLQMLVAMAASRPFVKVLDLPGFCRGEARNEAMKAARGDWYCFFDDDTIVAPGHFWHLEELITEFSDAVVFGGGQTMDYENSGIFERTIYRVMASPFGSGPFISRFTPAQDTYLTASENLILCNLCVKKEFLKSAGLSFEGHLTSAEENLLLNKMAALGAHMVLSARLNIVHRRRTSLERFIRQVFGSGAGRAQITLYDRAGYNLFTLLPPSALAAAAIGLIIYPRGSLQMLAAYALMAVFFSVRIGLAEWDRRAFFIALKAFPGLHLAYALGWFCGIWGVISDRMNGRVRPSRCVCE